MILRRLAYESFVHDCFALELIFGPVMTCISWSKYHFGQLSVQLQVPSVLDCPFSEIFFQMSQEYEYRNIIFNRITQIFILSFSIFIAVERIFYESANLSDHGSISWYHILAVEWRSIVKKVIIDIRHYAQSFSQIH